MSMPPVPSSSFIPKRNSATRPKTVRRYNFFILGAIAYSLFVAAPLASAALFIYQIRTESKFAESVKNLEEQIQTFNEADLARVVEFNDRLSLGKQILDTHVSFVTLLTLLESSTAETIQFNSLAIKRTDANTVDVSAKLTTDALDGALFQRGTYSTNAKIKDTKLSNVAFVPAAEATEAEPAKRSGVALEAKFTFAADSILYAPKVTVSTTTDSVDATSATTTSATTTIALPSNETTI